MNILLLAAGEGKRFSESGFDRPKPLISVNMGDTMLSKVVESVKDLQFFNAKLLIVMQKGHLQRSYKEYGCDVNVDGYRLANRIDWDNYYKIIELNKQTGGAVDSSLFASKYISNDEELLIINSDQYVNVDWIDFINYARQFDACTLTFKSDGDPKWSYVEINDYDGKVLVDKVAEKQLLPGNNANCGMYYFRTGLLYLNAVASMIQKNIRVNEEFYVAPCINELCREYSVSHYQILPSNFYALGTPADLVNSRDLLNWD